MRLFQNDVVLLQKCGCVELHYNTWVIAICSLAVSLQSLHSISYSVHV